MKKKTLSNLLIRGAVSGWLAHFVALACTFLITPILLDHLGDASYGVWSLIVTVTGYYGLLDFGISNSATKYLSEYEAQNDTGGIQAIISLSFRIFVWLACLVLFLSSMVGFLLPYLFSLPSYSPVSIRATAMMCGGSMACSLLGSIFRAYIRAIGGFTFAALMTIFHQVATAVGMVLVVQAGGSIVGMAACLLVICVIRELVTVFAARLYFKMPRIKFRIQCHTTRSKILKFGGLVFAAQLTRKLTQRIGTLVGAWLGGTTAIAFYSIAETACEKSLALINPISQMALPSASAKSALGHQESVDRVLIILPRVYVLVGSFMALSLWLYGKSFLAIWIDPRFAESCFPILSVLAISLPMRSLVSGFTVVLQGFGYADRVVRAALIEGVLLVVACLILTPFLGLVGLAWAVVVSSSISGWLVLPAIASRSTRYNPVQLTALITLPPAAAVILGWGSKFLFAGNRAPTTYLEIVLRLSVIGTITAIAAAISCADSALRRDSMKAFLKRIGSASS